MPLHDYRCRVCRHRQNDVYRSIEIGARGNPPVHCGVPMVWIPQVGRMDAYEPGTAFTTPVRQPDGSYKDVTIASLSQIRALERDSEQRARNGEGQQMIWRDFSQSRSNRDVHTMGPDPTQEITPEIRRKFRPLAECIGDGSDDYGPGVNDSNTSPFDAGD